MKKCVRHPDGPKHADGRCALCRRQKASDWYRANKSRAQARNKAGYEANKEQRKADARAWYEANRERAAERKKQYAIENPHIEHAARLRRRNFTAEAFEAALVMQGYQCAICKADLADAPRKLLHADHCHATGRPRGVLCPKCNVGLGSFMDSVENLRRAIAYLENPPLDIV
jgi:DNA-directed RNA polymerase subunit RPC12/RpoP